jgi:uncharacterized protein (TIGR02145 family)
MIYKGRISPILNYVGVFALSMFVAASAVYIYSPVVGSHADETGIRSATSTVPTVSLSLDMSEMDFEFTPTSSGVFDSKTVTVTANTDSTGGYELSLFADGDSADMLAAGSDMTIASDFTGTVTSATMAANKWGYSTDGTNFSKVPVQGSGAIIRDLDHTPSSAEQINTVTIGMKVNSTLKTGIYKKDVVFSLLAHEPLITIHEISTMQEMTSTICANTKTPTKSATAIDWDGSHRDDVNYVQRARLEDTRDGNYYLVSKLADGNCWMSQSLALDLTANEPIIASNNDGTTTTVTPNNTTQTTTGITWAQADNNWRSYKPQASANEIYYQSGTTKSSSPSGSGATYDWEKAGNYYNWYAATAGTGASSMTGSDATASICPKGWRLPSNSGIKSYYNLITTTYGLASSSDGSLALRANPLNFNLSGYYAYYNGAMRGQGSYGYYWSGTAYSSATDAYDLLFNTSSIYPQGSFGQGYGFSVRCVAI